MESELKVRQPFSSDPNTLLEALDEIEDDAGHAVIRQRERKDTLQHIAKARDQMRAMGRARQYAESEMHDITMTVRALRDAISGAAPAWCVRCSRRLRARTPAGLGSLTTSRRTGR